MRNTLSNIKFVNIEFLYQHAKLFYAYRDKKVEAN